jgi:hypothetical protein
VLENDEYICGTVQCVVRLGTISGSGEIFVAVGHHEPKTDVKAYHINYHYI